MLRSAAVTALAAGRHRRTPEGATQAAAGAQPDAGVRTDIQALRAVAVAAVLIYHLWPNRLTGGFTGVDVFFVISGFLITEHLLAHPPTGVRGLLGFWSRRVRRLLPAALLVLLATVAASWVLVPDTQWEDIASQARAAALYVVNWRLAAESVDYLAAQNAPTPIQHFWSLSVEEQFYLGWPILILVLGLIAGSRQRVRKVVVAAGLGLVVAVSLAYSVHYTATVPDRAYFVTPTRIWELGFGGLTAVLVSRRVFGRDRAVPSPLPTAIRIALVWGGLIAIGWTYLVYSGSTPFPGWRAALPVLGACAFIAAADPRRSISPGRVLAVRPVQWLGDVSYSLYLWHWPLIVLVPYVSGGHLGMLDKIVILVVSLVVAGLSKRFIEDPPRRRRWAYPLASPYGLATAGIAVVVAVTAVQIVQVDHRTRQAEQRVHQALSARTSCFGAAAVAAGTDRCPVHNSGTLTPTPIAAKKDHSDAYADVSGESHDCLSYPPLFPFRTCDRGDPHGTTSVALVGNSHAAQWLPALESIAKVRHWRITTFIVSECVASRTPEMWDTAAESARCAAWTRHAERNIRQGHFDLVVYSNRIIHPATGQTTAAASHDAYEAGYEQTLSSFAAAGVPVAVLRDTPFVGHDVPTCLSTHEDDYSACAGRRDDWLPDDPAIPAVHGLDAKNVRLVDLSHFFCQGQHCPAQIGGVPVYFDGSHMTATFSATLARYLEPALNQPVR